MKKSKWQKDLDLAREKHLKYKVNFIKTITLENFEWLMKNPNNPAEHILTTRNGMNIFITKKERIECVSIREEFQRLISLNEASDDRRKQIVHEQQYQNYLSKKKKSEKKY